MSADVEKQKRSSENDNDNLNNMSNSSYYSSGTTSEERILKSSKERRSSNDRDDDERKNLRSRAESSDYRGGSLECNRSSRSRRKTSDFDNHCRSRRSSRSRSRDRTLTNHSGSLNRQTLDSSSNAGSEKAFEDEAPVSILQDFIPVLCFFLLWFRNAHVALVGTLRPQLRHPQPQQGRLSVNFPQLLLVSRLL